MSALFNTLRPSLRTAAGGYGRLAGGYGHTAGGSGRTFSTSTPRAVSKMILTGRLGAEPEIQATASGHEVVRYAIGCSYGRSTDRKTSWFQVSSFQNEGTQRDFLLNLPKGSLVYVEADAAMRTYEDAEGKKQSRLNLTQREFP